jgi:hypothetical protein
MAYTPAPFNPLTPYQNQVATELNLANQNFTILSQAFLNNDPVSNPILRASYVGTTAPTSPVAGTTWLDTSTTPSTLKVYDGVNWQSNVVNSDNADTVDGFHASQTPAPNTIPVADDTGKIADGWLNFVANDPKVKTALNASGDAPIYACRAWVNFDGTTNPPTIRASGNVSSIIKNGVGDYTINFAIPMPDEYYTVHLANVDKIGGTWSLKILSDIGTSYPYTYTTSAVRVGFGGDGNYSGDLKLINVSVFR